MSAFSAETRLALLNQLFAGRSIDQAASSLGLSAGQARDAARNHGWPDAAGMSRARDFLVRKTRTARPPEEEEGTDVIQTMLDDVRAHDVARIRTAGAKVEKAIADLRAMLDDDEKNRHLREQIKQLEEQLRAAKKKLKPVASSSNNTGGSTAHANQRARLERLGVTTADVRTWMRENGHEMEPKARLIKGEVLDLFEASLGASA